ncbi:hypothetical protein DRW41_08250 [Neobacillus piezotolerans]|uniref:Uncharacterized protein n=1 Tax=Neobacillus piezotolerans TaxID=2259171 RepID=A0A3D8GTY0_9BACI|nr:hypothetical protein [Neobacillus piezotolerans]RDU37802.1 hypothetical protein DRW41_08250 [Neobacillus piezotolerans]
MKKWLLSSIGIAAIIAVLFTFLKNGPTNPVSLGEHINLLASGNSLPANFEEISFQNENHPGNKYLVKKVGNQIGYQKMWSYFGLDSARIPAIDFSKKAVIFIGTYESGSCPYKFEEAAIRAAGEELAIRLAAASGVCTTDASPRTFVIGIEKDASENMRNFVVLQGRKEISVPVLEE